MRPKGGGRRRKIWKASKDVWNPCNPLRSHKTAKAFFGKVWSKTRDFWRSLEKGLEGAFIPPPLLPPWIVEERSDEATQEQRHAAPGLLRSASPFVREKRPVWTEKRKARFIQGDGRRPVRNLPMTARENYGYFFPKPDCLLGSKFSRSGSLLRDESAVY